MVESQPSKLLVASSILVSRSIPLGISFIQAPGSGRVNETKQVYPFVK